MKITNIEIIPIFVPLANRYATEAVRLNGIGHRVVYRIETDAGIVGYGDQRIRPGGCPPQSTVEPLISHSPFDYINNNLNGGLGSALYDVMGKYLDEPAYKLMGPKVRDAISVAAWTRPCDPDTFAQEIQRAASEGYTHFKMHSCEYHDVIEQTRAAEIVAPPDFKIHWDFNHNRTLAAVLPLVAELERNHPIVGYIEDPILRTDIEGWHAIREQSRLPIVMHVPQLGGSQELIRRLADIYMVGGTIGNTLARGTACAQANVQVIMQHGAGTLGKAMALHMCAVLPTATGHAICLDDQYEEDYTTERIPVTEGFSPVPERPGLGFDVDEDALRRMAAREPDVIPNHVWILALPGGLEIYTPGPPRVSRLTGREEGTIRGLATRIWEDDGSSEFQKMYDRVQKEGSVRMTA